MKRERRSARGAYDAVVDLVERNGLHDQALALVKKTYDIRGGALSPAPAEPLLNDFRDPDLLPPLRPGTDFFREKKATDVVVLGCAFAPGGKSVRQMEVAVSVGNVTKRLAVFGRRMVVFTRSGTPSFSSPEPFTEMPLSWQNAYGGVDPRVPLPDQGQAGVQALLTIDHPGLYPRNPFGKGYAVVEEPIEGLELPSLEDPDDLLTPERFLVRDPRLWWRQPLPWSLGFTHPMMFPRYVYLNPSGDAWFPGPDDESLPEVARGFLPRGYRELPRETGGPHAGFYQEASHGMCFPSLQGGVRIRLEGLHPEQSSIEVDVPDPRDTRLDFVLAGKRRSALPALHHVVLRPAEGKVCLVFGATVPLPRPFVPGVHKEIPVAISVDGDAPVDYVPPRPLKEVLAAAGVR